MNNFKIVLVEPEIPQNTGNIIRTCACTGSDLYIVGQPGFVFTDKHLKRCGLDYHDAANIIRYPDIQTLLDDFPDSNFYWFTTKSKNRYSSVSFKFGDFLVFGPESRGLDEDLLKKYHKNALTLPMRKGQRSLNLSNSVATAVYEAVRQCGLPD
ncbi:MAG: tRNA (cytidine(34)-2'-O)-methyltransferase [Candidatus Gastranaerophilaceae bacterium]